MHMKKPNERQIIQTICETMRQHLTAEADRIIATLKPRNKRRHRTLRNGLKGPRTNTMVAQLKQFKSFLDTHPVTGDISRITRAHQCWLMHPNWRNQAKAQGDHRGYSGHKALAAAW